MTVIGIVIASPDLAFAWADCQEFVDGRPVRQVPKLVCNATARIAGAATGWAALAERFDEVVIRALDMDVLAESLPALLRRESATLAGRRYDPETFAGNAFCLAGWSTRFGRFVGVTLQADTYFEPRRTFTFAAPHAPDLAAMGATTLDDVSGVIVGQVRDLGLVTTGPVIGATLTASGITTRTLLTLEPAP